MPQMSPFNWTILLIMFLGSLVLVMSKISIIKPLNSCSFNVLHMNNSYSEWTW